MSSTAQMSVEDVVAQATDGTALRAYRAATLAAEDAREAARTAHHQAMIAAGAAEVARRAAILAVDCPVRSCRAVAEQMCTPSRDPYAPACLTHGLRDDLSGVNGAWAQGRALRSVRVAALTV